MGVENDFSGLTSMQNWLKTQPHLPQNIGKYSRCFYIFFKKKSSVGGYKLYSCSNVTRG